MGYLQNSEPMIYIWVGYAADFFLVEEKGDVKYKAEEKS